MPLPRVTICMPVFNGGHYFHSAFASALAQDHANLEILLVNDSSADAGETEHIAQAHGNRVRCLRQECRGVAGALNTALANMSGDFFALPSQDDFPLRHKTAAQMAYLDRLGRPGACVFPDCDLIGPKDEPIASIPARTHTRRWRSARAMPCGRQ